MPKLTIIYGDKTLYDGVEVDELTWSDTPTQVGIAAKLPAAQATKPGGGGGLLDLLTSARRQQTEAIATDHKRALQAVETPDDTEGGADSE